MKNLLLSIFLVLSILSGSKAAIQYVPTVPATHVSGGGGIALDGSACANTSGATTSLSCGNITVTTGSDIHCWWAADQSNGGNLIQITDTTNNVQYIITRASFGNGTNFYISGKGQADMPNAAGGTYAPTLTQGKSNFASITCQAYKNVRTTAFLDSGAINQTNIVTTNSTACNAGTTQTPGQNGEMVLGNAMNSGGSSGVTVGSGYTLLTGMATNFQWGEYKIQTTATAENAPVTWGTSDKCHDDMVALLPAAATAGASPINAEFINFSGGTSGNAPTSATMGASTFGVLGFSTSNSTTADWTCQNANSMLTYTNAGLSSTLLNSIFTNGVSYTGSGGLNFRITTVTGAPGTNNCNAVIGNGAGYPSMSYTAHITTSIPQNDSGTQYSVWQIGSAASSGTEECDPYIIGNGTNLFFGQEHNGGGSGASIQIATNTEYIVWETYQSGVGCTLHVYNSSGTELTGSPAICSSLALGHRCTSDFGTGQPGQLELGISGAEIETSGHVIDARNFVIDSTGAYHP